MNNSILFKITSDLAITPRHGKEARAEASPPCAEHEVHDKGPPGPAYLNRMLWEKLSLTSFACSGAGMPRVVSRTPSTASNR